MPVYKFGGVTPVIHPTAFVHPSAEVIGDVIIGDGVYVGPLAVLRGDFGRLIIKKGANIQDCCVMHGFPGENTILEQNVHVGHGAIVHGCVIKENTLVGMNAVVMDLSVIGKESIIGANSFIKAKSTYPERSMIIGSPAKRTRDVADQELAWKENGTQLYQRLAERCHSELVLTEPLTEIEENRPQVEWDIVHIPKR
ncbi:MAG: phenylacetic acid degradation protein PaaY [Vibrio sp.]